MAFKNEKISEQDREWVSKLVNYESIRAISKWVHRFERISSIWTVDRDRDAYLILLGGGGMPDDVGRLPYAVLVLDGELVVFNVVRKGVGNNTTGRRTVFEVSNVIVPSGLNVRYTEVQRLIKDALEENNLGDPFANDGTVASPNMIARSHVLSFDVEFK